MRRGRTIIPSLLALLLALLLAPERASAQASGAQGELYRRAFAAFEAERYAAAIELLHAALELGDLNILRLSLGRALFKEGRCAEADRELEAALTAPAVEHPSGDEVRARVVAYRADIRRTCPAIEAVAGLEAGSSTTQAPSRERTELDVRSTQPAPTAPAGPGLSDVSAHGPPWGWILGIGGAGVLAATVLSDVLWLGGEIDEFQASRRVGDGRAAALKEDIETLQAVVIGGYIVGGALVAAGGLLLLLQGDAPTADRPRVTATARGVRLAATARGVRLAVTARGVRLEF